MTNAAVRQLDSKGEIYAAVDERGSIIGTGTKEVCDFLVALANHELRPSAKVVSVPRTNRATVRSAIAI